MLLSVAIIARDEERFIGGCLESLAGVADEVVVLLDTRTRDHTAQLCHAYGATVFAEPWRGFSRQRNRALELCQGAWVLFLDADERLTPDLRQELATLREHTLAAPLSLPSPVPVGYWLPRYNVFFGQVVRGGGWYPDYQLRLVRREVARYDAGQEVHEVVALAGGGKTAHLRGHLLHINIEQVGEFWRKQAGYALAEARVLQRSGRQTHLRNFVGAPAREFWHRYGQLGGWRDGLLGLFLCGSLAWFEVVKYGCLVLINNRSRHNH